MDSRGPVPTTKESLFFWKRQILFETSDGNSTSNAVAATTGPASGALFLMDLKFNLASVVRTAYNT
jgi:hypothetical protein